MSLDLSLLPYFGDGKSTNFSQQVLSCDSGDLDLILKIAAVDVDDGFSSYLSRNDDYDEPHYGETLETPYGERLQWVHAKKLKPILTEGPVGAFVNALDDHHKVALYWK